MTREEFIHNVEEQVLNYITFHNAPDRNAQIRVNPLLKTTAPITGQEYLAEIADIQENIEIMAAADRPESEDDANYQVRQDPDFYPILSLISNGQPDMEAITRMASHYFD